MAKAPTSTETTAADPLAELIARVAGLLADLGALTARVDDMADVLAALPSRDSLELTDRAVKQLRDDYPRLSTGLAELRTNQAELRQDVADLQAGGGLKLVGDSGPALAAEAIRELRGKIMGREILSIDRASFVTHAEAANALGIAIDQVFSAARRADGRIGVVTVDGQKLIEGQD